MNRSQRSKRSVSSKSTADEWRRGEDVLKTSPSPPKRKINRRDTKMGLKKASEKTSKPDRRKSIILKRIESDFAVSFESETLSKRRTRQQSLAIIPKAENKVVKTQITRAKSEKLITKKETSTALFTSPTVKIQKLRATDIETKSRRLEDSKKSLSKPETVSISKASFHSKSPVKTRQTRRKSMVKMSEFKTSFTKLEYSKTSRIEAKSNQAKLESSDPSPSKEKTHPLKAKIKESQDKSPEKKLSQKSKMEKKAEKVKTPLRKPVKRLSNLTPSPMPLKTKRLTRSSAKKRVKIYAESPSVSSDYRKTPKSANHVNRVASPLTSVKKSIITLKPYTPKPEEPLKILKQTLKRNVDTEIRNSLKTDVSDFIQPSIVSVRKPLKSVTLSSDASISEKSSRSPKISVTTPVKNGFHHQQQEESNSKSFEAPSTPVSSRKSVSFRRFRGSVRLMENESLKTNDASTSIISMDNPLISTPKRLRTSMEHDLSDEHESSIDFGEVSRSHELSKSLDSSSFITHDSSYSGHMEESITDASSEKNAEQSNKRSYCSLM